MVKTENKKGKKKKKVGPGLRFRDFADNIQVINLEQIAEFKSGGTPSKENDKFWDGDIPWISAVSMRGKYYSKSERTITLEGLKNGSKLSLKGSILILVRGSMLYNKIPVGITSKDVAFNQDLKSITLNDLSNSEFLYQWFSAKQHFLLSKVVGTGIGAGKLDMDDIKKLKINLPSLPEQKKIATFLSAIDKKIQQLTRKKEALIQYKKGVMQQLFSGQLRFKDEDGNDFLAWEEKRLGEIGEFKNGINKASKDFGFGSPFVNLMDVFGKSELSSEEFGLINSNESEQKLYSLKKGDVLFIRSSVKRTGVGETIAVAENLPKTVYSGFLIRFRDSGVFNLNFKKYCFSYRSFRKELLSYATTSANTNINQESLNKIKIILPSISEQKIISEFLINLDQKINSTTTQITQTQTFKKGLLQKLFV